MNKVLQYLKEFLEAVLQFIQSKLQKAPEKAPEQPTVEVPQIPVPTVPPVVEVPKSPDTKPETPVPTPPPVEVPTQPPVESLPNHMPSGVYDLGDATNGHLSNVYYSLPSTFKFTTSVKKRVTTAGYKHGQGGMVVVQDGVTNGPFSQMWTGSVEAGSHTISFTGSGLILFNVL